MALVPSPLILGLFKNRLVMFCRLSQLHLAAFDEQVFRFFGISFVAVSRDIILLSKTADPSFSSDRYGVLTPVSDYPVVLC